MEFESTRNTNIAASKLISEQITIPTPAAAKQGSDVECRKVLLFPESGKTVNFGDEDVDATYPAIPATGLTLEIANTNMLYFFGTAGEKALLTILE